MIKIDLKGGKPPKAHELLARRVTRLAMEDHFAGRVLYRSGRELTTRFCEVGTRDHDRMAAVIYSTTRRML